VDLRGRLRHPQRLGRALPRGPRRRAHPEPLDGPAPLGGRLRLATPRGHQRRPLRRPRRRRHGPRGGGRLGPGGRAQSPPALGGWWRELHPRRHPARGVCRDRRGRTVATDAGVCHRAGQQQPRAVPLGRRRRDRTRDHPQLRRRLRRVSLRGRPAQPRRGVRAREPRPGDPAAPLGRRRGALHPHPAHAQPHAGLRPLRRRQHRVDRLRRRGAATLGGWRPLRAHDVAHPRAVSALRVRVALRLRRQPRRRVCPRPLRRPGRPLRRAPAPADAARRRLLQPRHRRGRVRRRVARDVPVSARSARRGRPPRRGRTARHGPRRTRPPSATSATRPTRPRPSTPHVDATVAEDRVAPTADVPVARDVAPTDAGLAPADAGRPVPPTADGCRCRAAAPPRSPPAGLGLLVALGLAGLHRRRRLPPR
jgi:hypothetical protein